MPQHPVQKYQVGVDIPVKRNLIMNGNLNVWQRGTLFPGVSMGVSIPIYTADRWLVGSVSNHGVYTVQRSTNVPNSIFNYSLEKMVTTANGVVAAGDLNGITHRIEGYNFRPIYQQPFTLTFWVQSNVTGTYTISFHNNSFDRSYVAPFTINAPNTWEFKTITVTAIPIGGTWNFEDLTGLQVSLILVAGSTFITGTPNTWVTGNLSGVAGMVNFDSTVGNYIRITGYQLEAGTIATPFELRPFGEELALCQRYYEKSYNINVDPGTILGHTHGVGNILMNQNDPTAGGSFNNFGGAENRIFFKANKRINPSVTTYSNVTGAPGVAARYNSAPSAGSYLGDELTNLTIRSSYIHSQIGPPPFIALFEYLQFDWTAEAEL